MRLHTLYPLRNGDPIRLRPEEIAALRTEAAATSDEDLTIDVCFICSETTIVSRVAGGTGTTSARLTLTPGPLCEDLVTAMGAPRTPTIEFITHAVLGDRYLSTSVPAPDFESPP